MKRQEGFLISLYIPSPGSPVRALTPTQSSLWKSLHHLIYPIVPGDLVREKRSLRATVSKRESDTSRETP